MSKSPEFSTFPSLSHCFSSGSNSYGRPFHCTQVPCPSDLCVCMKTGPGKPGPGSRFLTCLNLTGPKLAMALRIVTLWRALMCRHVTCRKFKGNTVCCPLQSRWWCLDTTSGSQERNRRTRNMGLLAGFPVCVENMTRVLKETHIPCVRNEASRSKVTYRLWSVTSRHPDQRLEQT